MTKQDEKITEDGNTEQDESVGFVFVLPQLDLAHLVKFPEAIRISKFSGMDETALYHLQFTPQEGAISGTICALRSIADVLSNLIGYEGSTHLLQTISAQSGKIGEN